MNEKHLRLMELVHQEAAVAFWSIKGDNCGSDVSAKCEGECSLYHDCLREREINQLFVELREKQENKRPFFAELRAEAENKHPFATVGGT